MRKRRRASRPGRVEAGGITGHLPDACSKNPLHAGLAWASLQVYYWVFSPKANEHGHSTLPLDHPTPVSQRTRVGWEVGDGNQPWLFLSCGRRQQEQLGADKLSSHMLLPEQE